jgi:hypothetical protein
MTNQVPEWETSQPMNAIKTLASPATHREIILFIRHLLSSAREEARRETLEGFQNYLLKHGYCDVDVYAEMTPDGYENAISGYLANLDALEKTQL